MRPELENLLEATRSEVKRWNVLTIDLLLLAITLSSKHGDVFAAHFGEDGAVALREKVAAGRSVGDEPSVLELLTRVDGPDSIQNLAFELHEALHDELQRATASDTSVPAVAAAQDNQQLRGESEAAPQPHVPERIARFVEVVEPADVRGREDVVDAILGMIGRRHPRTPLLIGEPGSGRTSVLNSLAYRISADTYDGPLAGAAVLRVSAAAVVGADRAGALRRILDDVTGPAVLVLDDLEVLAAFGSQRVDLDVLGLIRSALGRDDVRIVLVIESSFAARVEVHDSELAAELLPLCLPPLPRPLTLQVCERLAKELADHHRVIVSNEVVRLACGVKGPNERLSQPGLGLSRLDAAATRAALRSDRTVRTEDLSSPGTAFATAPDIAALEEAIRRRVIGQDEAVADVSRRLALTRGELDLRPGRPDGVFLFVGPTGVGKTELARAICAQLFGDEERLIRLDMSEYAQDWALSRLIGPQPGFVGFTEPESWLTTRITAQPETVLLLDEVEKAHPSIWNAFLQVFDAGRLSDARGKVADFSHCVVAMTSNLGATAFSRAAIGFATADPRTSDRRRVLEAVTAAMPPELLNRIDEIVVFDPLSPEAIRNVARKEVFTAIDRLFGRGYRLEVGDDIIAHLALSGYNAAYGARHLQRNVERLLLQPLVDAAGFTLRAELTDGTISWRESAT